MEDAQERVKRLGPELQSDTSKKQKSYEVKEVPFIESQKGTQQLLSRRRLSSQSRSQGDRNQWLGRGKEVPFEEESVVVDVGVEFGKLSDSTWHWSLLNSSNNRYEEPAKEVRVV
ncbi:hypothetical protein Tco_0303571 [Tanacetum coccineum]